MDKSIARQGFCGVNKNNWSIATKKLDVYDNGLQKWVNDNGKYRLVEISEEDGLKIYVDGVMIYTNGSPVTHTIINQQNTPDKSISYVSDTKIQTPYNQNGITC